ncbi:MAG: HD domain-containing protein [bacterium]|nr:HD domain-containing protein [bacterium]
MKEKNWGQESDPDYQSTELPKKERGPSHRIERADVLKARNFLVETYQNQVKKGGQVTAEMAKTNLDHADRVAENARWIAQNEGLDIEMLELAATCHDCGKLKCGYRGGIDTFRHHITGAKMIYDFLQRLGKTPKVCDEVKNMVLAHSAIPFIKRWADDNEIGLPEPLTQEEFALRDADVLDQIDIWGFKKVVEIRQNHDSEFYEEDGGDIQKSIESALLTAQEAEKILRTETAKKIAAGYGKRLVRLLRKIQAPKVVDLKTWQESFQEFLDEEAKNRHQ